MPLIQCRECETEISNTIKTCPHCGVKILNIKNIETLKKYNKIAVWFFGTCVSLILVINLLLSALETPEIKQKRHATCQKNITCLYKKNISNISLYCSYAIENRASYDHDWTSISRYPEYRWKDQEAGIITAFGSNLKLKNGFGAWKNVRYWCDYNTNTKSVTNIEIE